VTEKKWLNFEKAFLVACSNLKLTVQEKFAESNRVVTHWACPCNTYGRFFAMAAGGNGIQHTGIKLTVLKMEG
jgi:SnoaL-like polyketide cyclase